MNTRSLQDKLSRRSPRHSLKEAVGHDLVELLNCALHGARMRVPAGSHAAGSVLNYGCPPLCVADLSSGDSLRATAPIGEVMRRFEPRVDSALTRIQAREAGPHTLVFEIDTQARGSREAIRLVLALDCLDGHFSLAGSSGNGR